MGARPQPRGAGVGTRKLGNIIGPPFSKFSNFRPNHRPGTTTLKTLKMVGFRLCSMLPNCCPRRRPWGAAAGDTASQRQQPSRREQGRRPHGPQAKGGRLEKNAVVRSQPGAKFQRFASGPWGRRPNSHREVPHSTQAGRSPRWQLRRRPDWPESSFENLAPDGCISAISVLFRGRRGMRGESEILKRENIFKWEVRPPSQAVGRL